MAYYTMDKAIELAGKHTERKPPKFNGNPLIVNYIPAFKKEFPTYSKEDHYDAAFKCA